MLATVTGPVFSVGAILWRIGATQCDNQGTFVAEISLESLLEAQHADYDANFSHIEHEIACDEPPDVTGDFCTRWNERESTWRKSWSCRSRGTKQSRS